MKFPSLAATIALGLALSVPAVPEVQAAYSGIQRCRAADGTAVYTDKPCAAMGAQLEAMPNELAIRLRSEVARDPEGHASMATSFAATAQGMPVGRRSAAAGCARTPTQLAMDIQGSVALGDVNRLAESYHWVGMGHRESIPVMQRLERISRGQVVATQYFDVQIGAAAMYASAGDAAPASGSAGFLQLHVAADGGTQPYELNVERYAGCYFIRF